MMIQHNTAHKSAPRREKAVGRRQRGFSLVELMIAIAIMGILSAIALPSYRQYALRGSRVAAQAELLQLAALQEKIYLNSSSYAFGTNGVTAAYTGSKSGGLGRNTGKTHDGRYSLSLVALASSTSCTGSGTTPTAAGSQTFVLMASPVTSSTQAGDGDICVSESGRRLWGTLPW